MSLRLVLAHSLGWVCVAIGLAILDETTSWQLVATVYAEEKVSEPSEPKAEQAAQTVESAALTVEQLA